MGTRKPDAASKEQLWQDMHLLKRILQDERVAAVYSARDYEHMLFSHVLPKHEQFQSLLPFCCQGGEAMNAAVNRDKLHNSMHGGLGWAEPRYLLYRRALMQTCELLRDQDWVRGLDLGGQD